MGERTVESIISTHESERCYYLRGLAVFSVVAAHCTYEPNFPFLQKTTSILGLIGVPILFFLSGYFFNYGIPKRKFWKKKLRTVIIPWLTWGGLTYLIHIIGGDNFSIAEFVNWIIGHYTWLYYVPTLLLLYLFFDILGVTKTTLIISILISVISNIASVLSLIGDGYITLYQNPLNWLLFFAVGMLHRQGTFCRINKWEYSLLSLIVFGGLFECFYIFDITPFYWEIISIPFELSAIVLLYNFSNLLIAKKVTITIGKYSFFIYFVHMQIGLTITNMLINRLPFEIEQLGIAAVIIKPVFAVFVSAMIAYAVNIILIRLGLENCTDYLGLPIINNNKLSRIRKEYK